MQHHQSKNSRRGMTLVELLVVAAILVALLVISVPILKPMLEFRKTANAAQVLAGAFQQARMKSIQEGRSYGIRLIPFETAPTTAVQLRFQQELVRDFVNPFNIRVRVERINPDIEESPKAIIPYHFYEGEWIRVDWNDDHIVGIREARNHFLLGYTVQFNRLGRSLAFKAIGNSFRLKPPYDNLELPDIPEINDAMEYRVSGLTSVALWLPPVVMPRGSVVDLVFSGGETHDFAGGIKMVKTPDEPPDPDNIPASFSPRDGIEDIIVMFSPSGHVNLVYINKEPKKVNEMLYFCVGEWDRQIDANTGNTFAEDGRSNLQMPATFWVTLHPKTGGVRIAVNSPIRLTDNRLLWERLRDARKFASEHFFNVGER